MTRSIFRAVLGGVLLTLVSVAPSGAQETAAAGCSSGWASFGALGISSFSCDCTVTYRETDDISWIFRGEPTVTGIAEDGPASGKLRRGDVIVAIDGLLITTRAAGEKVASLKEGQAVALTVRRNGRVLEVQIRASDDCTTPGLVPAIASAPAAAPARPGAMTPLPTAPIRPPRLSGTTVPSIAAAPAAIPAIPPAPENPLTAWFGFGISCHNCRVRPGGIWEFSEYPTLYSVDPDSPAEKAGLRRGDVLMKIDGADLLTADGVRRFGNIDPGQTVTWSFRRGGASRSVRVTAAERPGSADLGEFRSLVDRMNNRQRVELETEMTQLQGNLARLGRESSVDGRDLAATRALVDNLRQSQGVRLKEQSEALQEAIAGLDRMRQPSPAIAGGDEQHLRFAGMVGNTNVEVRGLSSVDVSYDNETGELLIRTMDSIIRVKAPKR